MYILKKLNREKKVETAADAAALQAQGWDIVQEVRQDSGADIDGIAKKVSTKLAGQLNEMAKKSWEKPEILEEQQKADAEPEPDENPEPEEQQEVDAEPEQEEKPEKKPTSKSRKKE